MSGRYVLVAKWAKTKDGYAHVPFTVDELPEAEAETEADAPTLVLAKVWGRLHEFIAEHEKELVAGDDGGEAA